MERILNYYQKSVLLYPEFDGEILAKGLISDVYKNRLVIGFYWCLNFFVLSGLFFLRFREIDNISLAVGKLFFTYISLQFMALLLSPLALLIEKILSINSNNTFDDTKRNLLKNLTS